jgi:REP element-mobilizing transposase RayT
MPTRIYVHASWTTFARLPLIDTAVAGFLDRFFRVEAERHGARVLETGIVRDHVHVALELSPTFDVPRLMQGLKGASARIANRDGIATRQSLRWAQGYDLRSVGPRQLRGVIAYVKSQGERHPQQALASDVLQDAIGAEPGLQPTETSRADVPVRSSP